MTFDVRRAPEKRLFGLWADATEKTQPRDIPALSKAYYEKTGQTPGQVLPFCVLSRDFDPATGRFRLFVGGEASFPGLSELVLPEGYYASALVRPKLGFLWGPAIGEAKRAFYAEWIESQPYAPMNLEYEWHTEASVGKKPTVKLFFQMTPESQGNR